MTVVRKGLLVLGALLGCGAFAVALEGSFGVVDFIGAQKTIFQTGKADGVVSLSTLKDRKDLYAIGPVRDLDGEITIFDSKPSVSKVKGSEFEVENSWQYEAIFLVWTQQHAWRDVAIPPGVKSYLELQSFVKSQAAAAGIDTSRPFAFLIKDRPAELAWHINVDRADGQKITQELFAKSKVGYVLKDETVDIVGFYSEQHHGVFISRYAPAIPKDGAVSNAIHIHFVSRDSKATGHIDNITLGGNALLRLPSNQ